MITGLGYTFDNNKNSLKSVLIGRLTRFLLTKSLIFSDTIIFQNNSDKNTLLKLNIISNKIQTLRVYGSGVNLNQYKLSSLPKEHFFILNILISCRFLVKPTGEATPFGFIDVIN